MRLDEVIVTGTLILFLLGKGRINSRIFWMIPLLNQQQLL